MRRQRAGTDATGGLRCCEAVPEDGQPQVFWAALSWDFDETFFGDRVRVAIQIKRLERERQLLEDRIQTLDIESLPTLD